jgi:hypothetical protein
MASPLPRVRISRSYEFRASEAAVAAAVGPVPVRRMAPLPSARNGVVAATSVLETRHPDMARAITLLWGHPEMDTYFQRLWLAESNQAPIDPESMSELMLLAQLHVAVVPRRPEHNLAHIYGTRQRVTVDEASDVWAEVPSRR